MKAFQLTEKKEFMHLLLRSELFDHFLLSEASIHAAVHYDIDGRLNPSFFSEDERSVQQLEGLAYMPYGRLRPVFFELIKGKSAPTAFKFVLMLVLCSDINSTTGFWLLFLYFFRYFQYMSTLNGLLILEYCFFSSSFG